MKEEGREQAKRIILDYFFALGFSVRYQERKAKREERDMELAELNTAHKLRHEGPSWSETNGGQEFNFISQ